MIKHETAHLSEIERCALEAQYETEIATYYTTLTPSLGDAMWVALCHLGLNENDAALEITTAHAPHLNALAAAAHRANQNPIAARSVLDTILIEEQPPILRIIYHRELGLAQINEAEYPSAIENFTLALETARQYHSDKMIPSLALALSHALEISDDDHGALEVIDEGLRNANRTRRTHLLYRKALSQIHIGRYSDA